MGPGEVMVSQEKEDCNEFLRNFTIFGGEKGALQGIIRSSVKSVMKSCVNFTNIVI
jgi:hypothetical protein